LHHYAAIVALILESETLSLKMNKWGGNKFRDLQYDWS